MSEKQQNEIDLNTEAVTVNKNGSGDKLVSGDKSIYNDDKHIDKYHVNQTDTHTRTAPMAVPRSPDARSSEAASLMFGSNATTVDNRPITAIVKENGSDVNLPTTEDVENMEIEAWDESVESQGLIIQASLLHDSSAESHSDKKEQRQTIAKEVPIEEKGAIDIQWHDTINIRDQKKGRFQETCKRGSRQGIKITYGRREKTKNFRKWHMGPYACTRQEYGGANAI